MTSNARVVIDTNWVVSAVLLPRSIPRQAFDRAMEQGAVLISSATVAELPTLCRRHLHQGVVPGLPSGEAADFDRRIRQRRIAQGDAV